MSAAKRGRGAGRPTGRPRPAAVTYDRGCAQLGTIVATQALTGSSPSQSQHAAAEDPALRAQTITPKNWRAQSAELKRLSQSGILFPLKEMGTLKIARAFRNRSGLRCFSRCAVISILIGCGGCGEKRAGQNDKPAPEVTFKPQEMADALHAVIAADREVYCRQILQRLAGDEKLVKISARWQEDKALPEPAQVLRMGSEAVQQKGAEFHYVLRSLWPLNSKNAPETSTEKAGLQAVLDHPDSNYYAQESLGGRRYFTAVYADRAIVQSCVDCHNSRPETPKKDFKLGDVMGGLVVRVPLEF